MSMFKKLNTMFASEEDELYEEELESENMERKEQEYRPAKKQVNLSQGASGKKGDVLLVEPLVFADSKDILDDIRANKVVILNLNKLNVDTADRLLDFISGGIYALDAKLKTIGEDIYLCVPKGVDVAGDFSEGEY